MRVGINPYKEDVIHVYVINEVSEGFRMLVEDYKNLSLDLEELVIWLTLNSYIFVVIVTIENVTQNGYFVLEVRFEGSIPDLDILTEEMPRLFQAKLQDDKTIHESSLLTKRRFWRRKSIRFIVVLWILLFLLCLYRGEPRINDS